MRVALIDPLVNARLGTHRHQGAHLGLAYVAASLQQRGHEVLVIAAKFERLDVDQIIARLKRFGPHLVGSTSMTHEISYVGEMLAAIKSAFPECVTVVGGPHSTALPERTLREFPGIDVAVVGEGEQTACDLADAVALWQEPVEWQSIPGIAYRDSGDVRKTAPRAPITDLDSLPMPAWELFPPGIIWPVMTSRGCPFSCTFCQRVLGSKVRLRSVDSVLAEFDALESRLGRKGCIIRDETFGVNRAWTDEFLTKLTERNRRQGFQWNWQCNSRINLANETLYRRMREAGCQSVAFGIESGDQAIVDRVCKGIKLEKATEAIHMAKRAGLKTAAYFIIGHPDENWKSALRTVRFAAKCGAHSIAVGVMVPYPGTQIWELARKGQGGYKLLTEDWRAYDKYFGHALELRDLSRWQLEFLQSLTYLWFFVRRGRFSDLLRFVRRFGREVTTMLVRLLVPGRTPRTVETTEAGTEEPEPPLQFRPKLHPNRRRHEDSRPRRKAA